MPSENIKPWGTPKPSLIDPVKLRRRRFAASLTMTDLAQRAGIALSTVSGIERGYRNPSPRTLTQMAEVLGCSPTDLMPDLERAAA